MDNLARLVEKAGGTATAKYLVARGLSRRRIRQAVDAGLLRRLARGVYATAGADPQLAAIAAARAVPACITAAGRAGLWVLHEPALPHVTVNHGRGVAGCRVHRGPMRLSVPDIVIQCLRCLPELEALVVAESSVVLGRATLAQLRSRLPGPRNARLLRVVNRIDPHSQSIIECVARFHLQQAGFVVHSQVPVPGYGHLDLCVEGVLGLEVDGRSHHSGPDEFAEDRRRWNVMTLQGRPLLRVTYEMAVYRPDEMVAVVRQVLRRYAPKPR